MRFRTEAPDVDELAAHARPGRWPATGSTRPSGPSTPTPSGPTSTSATCKYMWLGTDLVFDAFKFFVRETPYGVMQIHGYPYDATGSTFIVEMHERRLAAGRLRPEHGDRDLLPGRVRRDLDRAGPRALRRRPRRARGAWPTTRAGSASPRSATRPGGHGNVVLLGDAAHTAHFSIGSGTKLAMEDALALAACLHEQPDVGQCARGVRGGAPPGRALHPAGGAGEPGVVREPRAVRPPGPGRSSRSTS